MVHSVKLALIAALIASAVLVRAEAQTPNYPPASPLQSSISRAPSDEYFPFFQLKVDKDNGFSTNQTAALPVTNTYVAAGAIAPTDHKSLLNCASSCAMTLAAGTIDGYPIIIKRQTGSAAATVTASIDGSSQTITPGAAGVMRLRWDAALSTYDTE